jgi:DNA-binding transcriptional regulator GbsR (MarR family)
MELPEAKQKFIESWGKLGSEWGINRTMAQVHALLLISPEALTTEEIMETLSISRGNANMTLRDLMGWGLIEKQHRAGERKEYFYADKDACVPVKEKSISMLIKTPGTLLVRSPKKEEKENLIPF